MKFVKFTEYLLTNEEYDLGINPGTELLLTEADIGEFQKRYENFDKCVLLSEVDDAKIYKGGDLSLMPEGSKVGFYYPGGLGDAACHTSIVSVLAYRYPKITFYVFSKMETAAVWKNNSWIYSGQAMSAPFTRASYDMMDLWLLGDAVVYNLKNKDQPNIYDVLLNHFHVPMEVEEKRPFLFVTDKDRENIFKKLARSMFYSENFLKEKFLIFAPAASKSNRSWPISKWYPFTSAAEAMGYRIITVDPSSMRYTERDLVAMASIADRIVTVDSAMLHLGAAFQKKTIALFGPFSPPMRSTTYTNCVSLWAKSECEMAPCCHHDKDFPDGCPSSSIGFCGVIDRIQPEDVLKVLKAMEDAPAQAEQLRPPTFEYGDDAARELKEHLAKLTEGLAAGTVTI